MAIQTTITAPTGVIAGTAYVRIASFAGTKLGMTVKVDAYLDKATADAKKKPISTTSVLLKLKNGATIADMYAALKASPAYAGATDV